MLTSWVSYLAALGAAAVFCWAYQQWLGWVVLIAVAALPGLSLLLSLPPLLRLHPALRCPARLRMGQQAQITLPLKCLLPMGRSPCRIRVTRTMTGERFLLESGEYLPGAHCGVLVCQAEKVRVYDFLGLFRLRFPPIPRREVFVAPDPVPVPEAQAQLRRLLSLWRPKPGGGFGENHELRLYRPGDPLNQIHWKLSAKTGKYIVREPMERIPGRVVLALNLTGTAEELDRKLGRLLWLSRCLLSQGVPHEIHAMTGSGSAAFPIREEAELLPGLERLMAQPPAAAGSDVQIPQDCLWQYRIGGEPDEG